MNDTQKYTKNGWSVLSDVPTDDDSQGFSVEYVGDDPWYYPVAIHTTTRESAIMICNCLAENAN